MSGNISKPMRKVLVALVLAGLVTPMPAQNKSAEAEDPNARTYVLEMENNPVSIVLKAYADKLGLVVLKDPGLPDAKITLTGKDLTKAEWLEAVQVELEMNGVHVEPYGTKFLRAIPTQNARKMGIPLITEAEIRPESGRVVSMVIPFKNMAASDAQNLINGMSTGKTQSILLERTNSILVTDTEQNINRILELVKVVDIDSPNATEQVETFPIKYASASEIKSALDLIVAESRKELESEKGSKNKAPTGITSGAATPARAHTLLGKKAEPAAPALPESLVVTDADRGMIRGKVVIVADDRSNKLIIITGKENMKFFARIIKELDVETTPDTLVKVYRLKYANAEDTADLINDLIGNSGSTKSSGKSNTNANSKNMTGSNITKGTPSGTGAKKTAANQRTGEAKAGELTKENTTVLADKRINGLIVMTQKDLVPTMEKIIESMDVKLSQVLIETAIIEVTLGDGLNFGIDWAQNGASKNSVSSSSGLTQNTLWTGSEGYMQALGGGSSGGAAAAQIAQGLVTNVFNSGNFTYAFKSSKLNLSAIIQTSQTDDHSKYLASPILMTVDNKEATIDATHMRYLFKGYQYSGSTYNGSAVPDYEQKELGIKIKMTPKINPNGTIMLTVETEYSAANGTQTIQGQTGQNINAETTSTRKMSADILLDNMQTAVLGGLTQTEVSDTATGIPLLMDIPWIGKWLFSSTKHTEDRTELLVFMQPYVLDDSASAQAEALRRKKSLSDARPWEDHGWSLSELADPVDKKEQLRRLKQEWEKQDQERQAKLAIEAEKVERARKLSQMSQSERDFWLEMHKDELKAEEQEELEKKMLDQNSQKELQKIADDYRDRKLEEANTSIQEAGKEAAKEAR